jgi:hypothetical protein
MDSGRSDWEGCRGGGWRVGTRGDGYLVGVTRKGGGQELMPGRS